ncbi:GTP-binding protein Era [Backusella circina FSU 941]|nr:GTP-binding protein Era [Backusella circina FSU 941]
MTRAKNRAGIPVESIKANTKKAPQKLKSNMKDWRTSAAYFNNTKPATHSEAKRAELKARLESLNFRQAAGLKERLVKVARDIVQPEHPHLLKVAVIGAANAGKSTLVNKIVGEEVSGVTSKAHTTRERVLAVLSQDNYQVVFLDTPGVIPNHNHAKMNRTLATSSWRSLDEADHVLIVVDANRSLSSSAAVMEDFLLDGLSKLNIPATLVFNKMDLIGQDDLVLKRVAEKYVNGYPKISKTLYISALQDESLDTLKHTLFDASIPKPWLYPADQKSEMADLKRVEEVIRIEFFKRLHQYIPYMLKQENVGWTDLKDGTLRIDQNVYVERDSQHKIVVGTNGRVINAVVEDATKHIAEVFKRPVKLFIQVKTKKNKIQ